jgi:hypothetical protein
MHPLRIIGKREVDPSDGNPCGTISEKPTWVNTGDVSSLSFTYCMKFSFYT